MNLFIFHRDLRLTDNTTLIHMIREEKLDIVPVFIFPPEQINPRENKYFSHNSVQFMIESLKDLYEQIKKKNGQLYFFKGDNMHVLKEIHKHHNIENIGFNYDYTPYALKRDNEITEWAQENNINVHCKEDILMYDIVNGQTKSPSTKNSYTVFTPFKNYCMKHLDVPRPDMFRSFKFKKLSLSNCSHYYEYKDLDDLYKKNDNVEIRGGRENGLKILSKIKNWKDYDKKRNCLNYKTTRLSAHNHFCTVSIREVYWTVADNLGKKSGIINELHWRDFYTNICYFYPNILGGQINKKNKSFKPKYDNIKWSYSKKNFELWCEGKTGVPIIDSCMRELNTTGFMHNRGRMVVGSFGCKDLMLDWRDLERYFATKLVDYSPIQNNMGWQFNSGSGPDAMMWLRVFNPYTQAIKFDPECEYIKKWIPELKEVDNHDILNWDKPEIYNKHLENGIKYYAPMIEHSEQRLKALALYKKALN